MKKLSSKPTTVMLIAFVAYLCAAPTQAHDFLSNGIYYNIISEEDLTCEVTYKGTDYYDALSYSGAVTIPTTVNYIGKTYNVIGIGEYAFYKCTELTSLTLGSNITYIKSGLKWKSLCMR